MIQLDRLSQSKLLFLSEILVSSSSGGSSVSWIALRMRRSRSGFDMVSNRRKVDKTVAEIRKRSGFRFGLGFTGDWGEGLCGIGGGVKKVSVTRPNPSPASPTKKNLAAFSNIGLCVRRRYCSIRTYLKLCLMFMGRSHWL